MARKAVDPSMLKGLIQGTEGQEVSRASSMTADPRFPVFRTPVNTDVLVYIPRTNVTVGENGEDMGLLTTIMHSWQKGKTFGQLRCMNGLTGGLYDQLGYTGTCPCCQAMEDVWNLRSAKIDAEAKRLGIDPQNDPTNLLKSVKERANGEMDMKPGEEYVTFPVVLIPLKAPMTPADDALENLQPQFVIWRKKRYEESLMSAFASVMNPPPHPAGQFWLWKFSYDTGGKQANARDSAKNAKYQLISDPSSIAILDKFRTKAEEVAQEFTNVKATEVLYANQFMYAEDLQTEVDGIMAGTRRMLDLIQSGGSMGQPGLEAGAVPGLGAGAAEASPLASFGAQPPAGNMGQAPASEAPAAPAAAPTGFGVAPGAAPAAAPGTIPGPVQFGQQ